METRLRRAGLAARNQTGSVIVSALHRAEPAEPRSHAVILTVTTGC
jgi:hypothetical protein